MDNQIEYMKRALEVKKENLRIQNIHLEEVEADMENFELDVDEYSFDFDNMIDESHEEVTIAGIKFSPSEVLKECDPVGYRVYCVDYVGEMDKSVSSEFQEMVEKKETIEEKITDLEDEIEDLEEEISLYEDEE